MVRVLDIPVLKVTPNMLDNFSLIAMVDVQPPYFLDIPIPRCDIVIDHHHYAPPSEASYSDIRTDYGATSTILGEYLLDAKAPISQRLSTALVYGIKTDTMSLERDITQADLDVFTNLYTRANLSMIRQIESASLDMAEIQIFIKALQHLRRIDKMACTWLGHIRHDDMIPRLADFSLQVAGAEWSFAAGISRGMVVCSARNVGYVRHAGELLHAVFGAIGSAGGHRSTAKAVIPVAQFKKKYCLKSSADIPETLFAVLQEANSHEGFPH
jgi:nanoRNase/pAp phosphatase (c-di-AMP/oligoRNAs hydrolase)